MDQDYNLTNTDKSTSVGDNNRTPKERENRTITILVTKKVDKDTENENIIKAALTNITTLASKYL
jgi:hypothetical protein